MSNVERFRHNKSAYERPTLGWRCGRSANWGSPCKQGPSARGVCSQTENPCTPRRTLAMWRGRLSVLAIGATLAIIALLALRTDSASRGLSSLNPGPLSSAHAHFSGEGACGTCHTAYGRGADGWWQAFWSGKALMPQDASADADHRLSAACVGCHSFGGNETKAHNRDFERRADLASTDCLQCHTEHKGRRVRIVTLTEAQCQSCHKQTIHDFAKNHPPFPGNFPYDHALSIRFDHVTHIGKHFKDATVAEKVPGGGCVGCHVVGQQARAIRPANFDTACAGCHTEGIASRDFVLFRWPEIETSTIAKDDVTKACGMSAEALAAGSDKKDEAFSAVSAEPPTKIAGLLMGVPVDSAADYEKQVQDLARAMMTDGADPLIEAAGARFKAEKTGRLFAGFNSEQARQAACAWSANQEFIPAGKAELTGWRATALELRYARPSHADPVIQAWLETVAATVPPDDADGKARMEAARKELMSVSDGPGQCMKCHTLAGPSDGAQTINWKVELRTAAPLTRFDHRPHLDLLGPEKTCTTCHRLDTGESGAGLLPITLASCTSCHAAGKVRDDCRTCHVYHQDHAFKKRMVQDAK
jgi:hypothetical protein